MERDLIPDTFAEEGAVLLLNKYQIIEKLSQGGFGKVYSCVNIESGDECIAKVNSDCLINDNEFEIAKNMSGEKGFPIV